MSALSPDQLWLKAWLHSKNAASTSGQQLVSMKLDRPSFQEARHCILQIHSLQQQLQEHAATLTSLQSELDDQEWKARVSEVETIKRELETLSSRFTPDLLRRFSRKISKIRRHKEWQKRRLHQLRATRDERKRKRETLHKDINEWRATRIARDLALKREEAKQKEAAKRLQLAERKSAKHKDLLKLITKLEQLRDLRRERFKREGHFFPEEDGEFFNRVKELNETLKVEEERLERAMTQAAENKREKGRQAKMMEQERPRDPTFEFWHEGELDLEGLIAIRRKWDAFIVAPVVPGASRVPPTYVTPSPPANRIWASCLIREPESEL